MMPNFSVKLLISLAIAAAPARSLRLVDTGARLDMGVEGHSAVYDGLDSIYIIGGLGYPGTQDLIQKYSIETGAVVPVTQFVPRVYGAAAMHGGDIVYFGGRDGDNRLMDGVYQISPLSRNYSLVSRTARPISHMAIASRSDQEISYLLGGYESTKFIDQVFSYNASSWQVQKVGRLHEPNFGAGAAWDSIRQVAYIFGGAGSEVLLAAGEFDPLRGSRRLPDLSDPVLYPCAVYVPEADAVYMTGGEKLMKFNAANHTSEAVDVDGWPEYINRATPVYVPKLARIYIIGGFGYFSGEPNQSYRDEIWYVDLEADRDH